MRFSLPWREGVRGRGKEVYRHKKVKQMRMIPNEKGFTLLEVLVTIAILGAIMGTMSAAAITIMKVSPQNKNWAIALRQVQNAGYWISRDVQMADNVTFDANPATPEFLTLRLPVMSANQSIVDRTLVYRLEDVSGAMKTLMRTDQDSGRQILIAENIYYDPAGDPDDSTKIISSVNQTLEVRMTAISGEAMVKRLYEARQRVPASE